MCRARAVRVPREAPRGGRLLNTSIPSSLDVVVVGGGIAGLVAALTAAPRARVAIVCKGALGDGATTWAQGGMAAALGADDSPDLHFADTVAAGRGLCDERAVRVLVEDAPTRVRELAAWGVAFDQDGDHLALGREAAHTRNRIIHAGGDATGREVEHALVARLRRSSVLAVEHATARRLRLDERGRCDGVEVVGEDGSVSVLGAGAVILATGGAGSLWRNTTNPAGATGDGVALAWEAGAAITGMEFEQFHPTALALAGAPRFLISEAVRGEGAHVVDGRGERFLFESDPRGELAGRDVVARAIWERLSRDGVDHVLLDCRPLGAMVRDRFPTITATCLAHGIDITEVAVPVAPAAHYTIGGVQTDVDGATSVPGLFACGEVASTGVHGANRLASNSLVEGAVFGHRAAVRALHDVAERPPSPADGAADVERPDPAPDGAAWSRLRDAMWDGCGLVRDAGGLAVALSAAEDASASASSALQRAATTASLVCRAALLREESRGAHVRSDFPQTNGWHEVSVMRNQRGH